MWWIDDKIGGIVRMVMEREIWRGKGREDFVWTSNYRRGDRGSLR